MTPPRTTETEMVRYVADFFRSFTAFLLFLTVGNFEYARRAHAVCKLALHYGICAGRMKKEGLYLSP